MPSPIDSVRLSIILPRDLYLELAQEYGVHPKTPPMHQWKGINQLICGLLEKGIMYERGLVSSGYTGDNLSIGKNIAPHDHEEVEPDGRRAIAEVAGDEAQAGGEREPPSCHGSVMLDYGDYWYCLTADHRVAK